MDIEKALKKIIRQYTAVDGNLYHSEKLFSAKAVLLWIKENAKDKKSLDYYLGLLEKHLKNDITLYWEDGTVKIRKEA
jgi:hypothetical protein